MGRNRKKNKNLPAHVYIDYGKQRKNGSWPRVKYFFEPVVENGKRNGKRIILGHSESEMYRNYSQLIERPRHIELMSDLIEDYLRNVAPTKGQRTYELEIIRAKFVKAFFGSLYPHEVTPQEIYRYIDIRSKKEIVAGKTIGGKRAANQERAFLSNVFNQGIRKGLLTDNPIRHVKPFILAPRDRYPEDWEVKAVYDEASPILRCIMDFAYLTGQRRGDILHIQESQLTEDGIRITQEKTKKKVNTKLLIEWSDALKECVNRARNLRDSIRSMYLFCKEDGQPYTTSGFDSMYKRAMRKALKNGKLKERFNFHDLRAKTYSDDENEQQRIKRAGHVNASMGRVYDRKVKKVKPLR